MHPFVSLQNSPSFCFFFSWEGGFFLIIFYSYLNCDQFPTWEECLEINPDTEAIYNARNKSLPSF